MMKPADTAPEFSQPSVVHSLCRALAALPAAPVWTPGTLAETVELIHPSVPLPVLRVIAAKVLRLHFEPVTVLDIEGAGLEHDEQITVCEFLAAAARTEADALRSEMRARRPVHSMSMVRPDAATGSE